MTVAVSFTHSCVPCNEDIICTPFVVYVVLGVNASFSQLQYMVKEQDLFVVICIIITGKYETVLSIALSTTSGTASVNTDVVSFNMTLYFSLMQRKRCLNATIIQDQLLEPEESFFINMESESRAVNIITRSTNVLIQDSSLVHFVFDLNEYFVTEGNQVLFCIMPVGTLKRSVEVSISIDTNGKKF